MIIKSILLIFTLVFLSLQIVSAQQIKQTLPDSIRNDYRYYMKKRNTYNTVGWVCLGTGVGLNVIGVLVDATGTVNYALGSSNSNAPTKGVGLSVAGTFIALAGIPFFISAHHNKMKASVSLKNAGITINNQTLYKSGYTALSVKIDL